MITSDCLMKLAMHSCCWMLFLMVFIIKYGFSVNSAPVEKFLCDLNTWNGCNFPDKFGFYFMNTVSSLRTPPPTFWGGGHQKLRAQSVTAFQQVDIEEIAAQSCNSSLLPCFSLFSRS